MNAKQETSKSCDGAKHEKDVERIGYNDKCGEEIKVRVKDEDNNSKTSSPKQESPRSVKEDELESTKVEMGEVKEENERLKKMLKRIENDYRSLQMRFFDILEYERRTTKSMEKSPSNETQMAEEPEISLCLGLQTSVKRKKDDQNKTPGKATEGAQLNSTKGLSLGLEFKSPSRIESSEMASEKSDEMEDVKQDEIGETWPPSKVLKSLKNSEKEEETSQSNNAKRARVCVRARCDTPTMNDGCQWRKYGQKIAKGNPCPRAYYRCTVAPSCPVRKQVQRCSSDMSILITTYEGTHNHQLPVAATAMASTTSAAASILMSGSSTSEDHSASTPTTTTANLNGINFTLQNNTRTGQFNLPSSSSPAPPTITLDLTTTPSPFNRRFSSNNLFTSSKYSSGSLDFSSSEANVFPTTWSNSYLNYGSLPSDKSPIGSLSFGKPPKQEQLCHYMEKPNQAATSSSQQLLTETLTKVLTSDPSFQCAVAAAISSMVGSSNNNITSTNRVTPDSAALNLRWSDQIQGVSVNTLSHNNKACAPTYLNMAPSSSSNSQTAGSLMVLQPPFPFSLSKSSSTPDLGDQLK